MYVGGVLVQVCADCHDRSTAYVDDELDRIGCRGLEVVADLLSEEFLDAA